MAFSHAIFQYKISIGFNPSLLNISGVTVSLTCTFQAEKLAEIQAELNSLELKMQKPSDIRRLLRKRAIRAVWRSLIPLATTFEEIHDETSDVEAHG